MDFVLIIIAGGLRLYDPVLYCGMESALLYWWDGVQFYLCTTFHVCRWLITTLHTYTVRLHNTV